MVSKRGTYTREFKVETVNLIIGSNQSVAEVARDWPSPGLVDTGLGCKVKIVATEKVFFQLNLFEIMFK